LIRPAQGAVFYLFQSLELDHLVKNGANLYLALGRYIYFESGYRVINSLGQFDVTAAGGVGEDLAHSADDE